MRESLRGIPPAVPHPDKPEIELPNPQMYRGLIEACKRASQIPGVEQDDLYISLLAFSQYQYIHDYIRDPRMHDRYISSLTPQLSKITGSLEQAIKE